MESKVRITVKNKPVSVVGVETLDVDFVFVAIHSPTVLGSSDAMTSVINEVTLKTRKKK